MTHRIFSRIIVLFAVLAQPVIAQQGLEPILPIDGHFSQGSGHLELSWFDAKNPRLGDVTVSRRDPMAIGDDSWQAIASTLGPVARFVDDTVVTSGKANPDGHDAVPHATDIFYAEMDGQWRGNQDGILLHNQLPSDYIEMQVGRIDFSGMSDLDLATELDLMRRYFDKNHHWRHGLLGDLRNAYGASPNLFVEQNTLRNIVGPGAITQGGHHDVGEEQPWLWGVDFGDWDGRRYTSDFANKAVFTINFGSGKQKIEQAYNQMVTLLAQPWYTIATGWGGRPAWWLHRMALGSTIGEVHMRTVNNGRVSAGNASDFEYFPTGEYEWRNPVWVNLLGDPTTHAFPLRPARALAQNTNGVLSWEPSLDDDVLGYHVYRATAENPFFERLSDRPVTAFTFSDPAPVEGARYMVRAYGKKKVYAGSFFTLSQGAFATQPTLIESETSFTISTTSGQSIVLPDVFDDAHTGAIHAIVSGPRIGQLTRDGTNWRFVPPAGYSGNITLPYSIATTQQTFAGELTIRVTAQ